MHDKTKLKIAVFSSILGILLLFLVLKFQKIEPIDVSEVNSNLLSKTVIVQGNVTAMITRENMTALIIDQDPDVSFIAFSRINIEKGSTVKITGRVGEYQDSLQVIIDKIELA